MTKTTARAIADRYFKMQCERLGPIDHKLYNQAADIAINEMLAEAGVKPAKARKSLKPRSLEDIYAVLKGEK